MKKNNGITLIALVITIIILLILAGITLSFVLGENGLLSKAKSSVEIDEKSQVNEEIQLMIDEFCLEKAKQQNFKSVNLSNLSDYLQEKNIEIIELTDEKLIIKYKEYKVEINTNFIVTVFGKTAINVSTVLEPDITTITNDSVTIDMSVKLENGLALKSITPITQGVEIIQANKLFRVSQNGLYQFNVIANNESSEIVDINIDNIDKTLPEVKISEIASECIVNEMQTITYEISDDKEVDISKCKYIFTAENTQYEQDNIIWDSAIDLTSTNSNIEKKFDTEGDYYMHILALDTAGNFLSFVSNKITVKMAPLYLFNEGAVDGYTWTQTHLQNGNATSMSNSIYFQGQNLTWIGARWELSNLDLSKYTQIHMELSTGTYLELSNTFVNQDYIRGVTISTRSSGSTAYRLIYTQTSNLSRAQIDGNLGEYSKSGVTLYLYFSRWNPGCYVHKIWVD